MAHGQVTYSLLVFKNAKSIPTSQLSAQIKLLTAPKGINPAFKDFYAELYKSEISFDKTECEIFFQDLDLPTEDAQRLGVPITLTELRCAITGMKKSPGWDGIPPEFYLAFWDELGQYPILVPRVERTGCSCFSRRM